MVIILSRKHFTVWVIPADMEDNTLFTNNKIQKKKKKKNWILKFSEECCKVVARTFWIHHSR